jgi:NADH dehydrogenase FAD-containing subunit
MILAVQGSNRFDEYTIFLRAMYTALHEVQEDDKEIVIYSAGPRRVNQMAREFVNVTERSLKARGIKIKLQKMPVSWLEENVFSIDYLAYFSKPKEPVSKLVQVAESKDLKVGIYRY